MRATHDEEPATLPVIPTALLRNLQERRALSDEELVGALIRFANTGSVAAYALLNTGAEMTGALQARYKALEPPEGTIQPGQLELRDALAKIVTGEVSGPLVAVWRRRAAGLVFLHEPGAQRRYRWLAFEQWASPPRPQLAYALLVLLEGDFRGELCRCNWCGRFFLKVKPRAGRRSPPIHRYCPDTDHRERAHQAGAVERMRDSRKRARAARARRNRRRS